MKWFQILCLYSHSESKSILIIDWYNLEIVKEILKYKFVQFINVIMFYETILKII